jgi:hypothetical protein
MIICREAELRRQEELELEQLKLEAILDCS